uniref:uncharacterized protein PF11_0207-like n=1 Tax=Osmia lignaria TaxID=473952 RepID=UPI001478461A|nr:uncharacterized protein PF11_0207-like [Osmia lignaria]XP_034195042.1 uncharacterized protein PF11_0207-like [Osmia lignaria]XP_034195332.1 uncharacterized protein PF11_0207-like [Osmia lignaria]
MIRELGEGLSKKIDASARNQEKEIREEIAGVKKEMEKEIVNLKEEIKKTEDKWMVQKRELEAKMELGAREKRNTENEEEAIKEKLRDLEGKWERKGKEEKWKNIIIKGLKAKREEMKEKTEEIMKVVGVQDAIEEVKVAGLAEGGKEMNMVQIKLKSMEFKTDVMAKKKALRGRDERIQEDLAWKERRIQWKLRRISKEEREKGKNVWVDYGRIRIEGKWWRWGEEREILKDWGGTELYEKQRET